MFEVFESKCCTEDLKRPVGGQKYLSKAHSCRDAAFYTEQQGTFDNNKNCDNTHVSS